jgi:hypothetical protein
MIKKLIVFAGFLLMSQSNFAAAEISHEGWDLHFNGYVEESNVFDSTRSFNGRTDFSLRQTRLYLRINAPEMDGWTMKGLVEGDFLGFDPAFTPTGAAANGATAESTFYEQGTFRMRNADVVLTHDTWHVLVGQWWSLFGYTPSYVIFNTSTSTPINTFQRDAQIRLTKDMSFTDSFKWQWDVDVERPTQRDAGIPNVDAGVKFMYTDRKAGRLLFDGGEFAPESTSIGVSGTYRQFVNQNTDGYVADKTTFTGGGIAVSGFIPILTSDDGKNFKNNLSFTGEYVTGSGLADTYSGFTGGTTATVAGAGQNTNLDPGLAAFDTSGNFQLIQTTEFTAQLQYILPFETLMAINLEYGRLHANNISNLVVASGAAYDYNELYAVDFVYQFNAAFRAIAEYSRVATHYASNATVAADIGAYPTNNRYAISTVFNF